MDVRREARQIWKHFGRYQLTIGESIIYYRFNADDSRYDRVYDEGYRRYHKGIRIPILWVDQTEPVGVRDVVDDVVVRRQEDRPVLLLPLRVRDQRQGPEVHLRGQLEVELGHREAAQ